MDPTIQFVKRQGLKLSLPLLLLTAACNDGGSQSTVESDALSLPSSASASIVGAQPSSSSLATGATAGPPQVEVDEVTDKVADEASLPLSEVLPGEANGEESTPAATYVATTAKAVTDIPEPTALAGLAIAALGLVALKRKQAA